MDTISKFKKAYQNRHQIAKDWKKDGRKVFGYVYSAVPEELIYAAGILPVHLTGGEDEKMAFKGETILPDFLCDYSQSCLGQGLEGIYDYLDGLVMTDACATVRSLLRAWTVHLNTPYYYYLNPPFQPTKEGRVYYTKEMARFKESIEDFCGKKISQRSLRSAIKVYDENRRLMKKLYALRAQDDTTLSGSQILEVVRAGLIMPKEEHNQMLRELLQELPHEGREKEGKIRIFLSMFIFEDCLTDEFNILEMIEGMGGDVVSDDFCWGPRYYWEPVGLKTDPMEAILERYLGKVPAGYRYPLQPRMDWLLKQVRKHKVRGAIFVIPKYCHPYLIEYPYIERSLKERGIPTLFLESDGAMPPQPVRVRLQAFTEMLG